MGPLLTRQFIMTIKRKRRLDIVLRLIFWVLFLTSLYGGWNEDVAEEPILTEQEIVIPIVTDNG